MKILKMHLAEAMLAVLAVLLVLLLYQGDGETGIEDVSYDRDWILSAGGEVRAYDVLPEVVSVPEGEEEIIIRKVLPEDFGAADSVGYYTSHQLSEVYVGGEKVYERKVPECARSKTPGNCWNFFRLYSRYEGKAVEIHIRNSYRSSSMKMPAVYYGSQSSIILRQIKNRFPSVVISFIMFTMGVLLVALWFTVGKKMYFHKGVPWLGLFSIHFAVWSAFETKIPVLMFGRPLLFSIVTFMSLKLMLLPFVFFIRTIYNAKGSKLLNVFAAACVIEFAFCFVAQIVGWADFRETLWITHVLGLGASVTVLVLGARMLVKKKQRVSPVKRDRKFWVNAACVCIICVCAVFDAINYYFGFYGDVAFFSRIGCLIYLFILSKQFLDESIKLIQAGRHAEEILEEAGLDGLTCLKNRRSFETDLYGIPPVQFPQYGVVMFDLNNLKMMNDRYGHAVGDCYIINGSEIIRDVFGDLGEIYRIGGDEFCLISDMITEEVFEEKRKRMGDWMQSLQGSYIKGAMQIASGFAKYNRSKDLNLQDTIRRADERMYRCKRKQKTTKNNSELA